MPQVDECGVCGGNSGTCALAAVLQVDLPAEMQAAAETNSLNMDAVFSTMARDVLADIGGLPILSSDISVNDYSSTSMLKHATAQLPQVSEARCGQAIDQHSICSWEISKAKIRTCD